MKAFSLISIMTALVLFTGITVQGFSAAKKTKTFVVVGYIGKAEYRIGKAKWKTLKIEDKVPETAEIRVAGKDDSLELAVLGESSFLITGGSQKKLTDILKANLVAKNNKGKVNDDLKVANNTEVAAVRGGNRRPNITTQLTEINLTAGPYVGKCEYRITTNDWVTIQYGMKLPEEAQVRLEKTNSKLTIMLSDKVLTNLTGPATLVLTDLVKK